MNLHRSRVTVGHCEPAVTRAVLKYIDFWDSGSWASHSVLRGGKMLRFSRSIKTLHTPTHFTDVTVRSNLMSKVKLLDEILSRISYDRSVLYTPKYKRIPQLVTAKDTVRMGTLVRNFIDNITMDQAYDVRKQLDPKEKLGKVGLELFLKCNKNHVTPLSTHLAVMMLDTYNRYSNEVGFLEMMLEELRDAQSYLMENRFMIEKNEDIDMLIDNLAFTQQDATTIKKVLDQLNYELPSDDIVRVVRGNTMEDTIDLSKGWKYRAGVLDTNEPYLRSLQIDKKKLVTVSESSLVLIFDGTLRDADKIQPSLHYATKQKQSLLLIVNGDVTGDALAAITINNNKNNRNGNPSKTIILKYFDKDHDNISLQENYDLVKFCQLPQGLGSIYSPKFSEYVPSSASANLFFGSMEAIKATTGECFLYNPSAALDDEIKNRSLQTTLTLNIGGQSEFEIDQRRASLDNILNNIMCHGLAEGFVPSHGIALAKAADYLSQQPLKDDSLMAKTVRAELIETLTLPMDQALQNKFGSNRFARAKLVSDTMNVGSFQNAYLPGYNKEVNTLTTGDIEPWNKLNQTLDNVAGFAKLITSCNTYVTRIFDKPKRE
ncbi:Tcm62 [Kluyveromyces lactis]|nr:Tcm62 [Kluyveromyces lactis]